MNRINQFARQLQSLVGANDVIEIDRSPMTKDNLRGFVVGASTQFLMLNIVDDSYFLNGFTIVWIDDIKRYRIVDNKGDLIKYVLSQRYPDGYLRMPEFNLEETEDLSFIQSIQEAYPLITVYREEINNTVCSIGRIEALKPKTFLLQTIDIDATWDNVQRFRYEDVTRIDFGGSYEEALWMYAEFLSQKGKNGKAK